MPEPHHNAPRDYRETTIRVYGTERVIRTERTGTVRQLEATHTKAVKAALEALHTEHTDREHAEGTASLQQRQWKDTPGFEGSGARAKHGALQNAINTHEQRRVRRFTLPKCNWDNARKPWPKVRYTDPATAGVADLHDHIEADIDALPQQTRAERNAA